MQRVTTATVWTLTVDDSDGIATTVHPSEAAAMIALRDNDSELELPDDDGELVDYLTHSTWEGGPGIVFYIESHDIVVAIASATPPPSDPIAAITEIRRLAAAANVAVSIVTISDVLMLKGIDTEANPAQAEAVLNSYEWRHWGDNWSDWFEGFDLND